MFITLSQLQNKEATLLPSVIDNTDGRLHVAFRGFNDEVGYHNVPWTKVVYTISIADRPQGIMVPNGLYTFERLSQFLMENAPGISLKMSKVTGLVTINTPEGGAVLLSKKLRRILGIDHNTLINGE